MRNCNEMAALVMRRIEEDRTLYRPHRIKKAIWLTVLITLLVALCAVTGAAVVKYRPPFLKRWLVPDDHVVDQTAEQTLEWTMGSGEKVTLYYVSSSKTFSGDKLHHYADSDGSEYVMTTEGKMIGRMPSDSSYEVLYDQKFPASIREMTEEQLQDLAAPYIAAMAGEEQFEKYGKYDVNWAEDQSSVQVDFIELYNDMVEVRRCTATLVLDTNEVILTASTTEYERFDFSQLDGITKEKIDAYVLKRMKRCFGNNPLPEYTVNSYTLFLNNNDRYYLDIDVTYPVESAHLDAEQVTTEEAWYSFKYLVGDPMKMSEEEATELGRRYFAETYGAAALERFNHTESRYNGVSYYIDFYKMYRDIFVLDSGSVTVEKTGALGSVHYRENQTDGLDLTLLDGINRADIVSFARKVAQKEYGDRLDDVECNGKIYVGKQDDAYVISFSVGCSIKDSPDDIGYVVGLPLRYQLGGAPMDDPTAIENAVVEELR